MLTLITSGCIIVVTWYGGLIMSAKSDEIRVSWKKGDDERDSGLMTPEDIIRFDDIAYGEDKLQVLDVYKPKADVDTKIPVIVNIHGGGWVYGTKETYQFYCMSLAQRGFAVVNFSYRLSPEVKFPSQLEDANIVFTWVMDNKDKYGLDTDNIFAVGDSAGAHLLGLYAGFLTKKKYAKKFNFKAPKGLKLKGIALNCGKYDLEEVGNGAELDPLIYEDFLKEGGTKKELKLTNVLKHITKKYPPTLYMTCTGDFLKDQAPLLGNKLLEKDIPHEFHYYGDAKHELGHVFHCNIKTDDAKRCNDDECNFFKKLI